MTILRETCICFRDLVMKITKLHDNDIGIDPFCHVTIPATCLAIFKAKYLYELWDVVTEEEKELAQIQNHPYRYQQAVFNNNRFFIQSITGNWSVAPHLAHKRFIESPIAIVPPGGYDNDTYSREAIQWISWYEKSARDNGQFITVQHAMRCRKYKVLGPDGSHFYKLDGFYIDPQTQQKVALSYHGCFWHQCKECYGNENSDAYIRTILREKYLQSKGFSVITMWQHSFHKMIRDNDLLIPYRYEIDFKLGMHFSVAGQIAFPFTIR